MRFRIASVLLPAVLAATALAQTSQHAVGLPLHFESGAGRIAPGLDYVARTDGYQIRLKRTGAVLVPAAKSGGQPLTMEFQGASAGAAATPAEKQPGVVSYFIGNDPAQWQHGLPMYGRVTYTAIYPGVDVTYYGTEAGKKGGEVEYDLNLAPHADPAKIAIQLTGAKATLAADGSIKFGGKDAIALRKPVAFQMIGSERKTVPASYILAGNTLRFRLGAYDHAVPLVIDPVVTYSTYLGGSFRDYVGVLLSGAYPSGQQAGSSQGVALDSRGNVYLAGYTESVDFPTKGGLGPPPVKNSGPGSGVPYVYVTKFNSNGTLAYSTYVGGSFGDIGAAIAVDSAGAAYVGGNTTSPDFPITAGAFQSICAPFQESATLEDGRCGAGDVVNAFLFKLDPAGSALSYSTFLGGTAYTQILAVAVDSKDQAYVAGSYSGQDNCYNPSGNAPHSFCFPTTAGALQGGAQEDYTSSAFVTVFNSTGTSLLYSTLIGDDTEVASPMATCPSNNCLGTAGLAVAVDGSGNFYTGGYSQSTRLPTTAGAFQTSTGPVNPQGSGGLVGNAFRGWMAKFSPVTTGGGSKASYLTYVGGSSATTVGDDAIASIAADASGNAYITSAITSRDFPVTSGAYQTKCGSVEGPTETCQTSYVAKMNPTGSGLVWSSYFGGSNTDNVADQVYSAGPLALDSAGNVYIACTARPGLETVNPLSVNQGGNPQACIAKFSPNGSKLLFASLFGGGTVGTQFQGGLALDSVDNIYLGGNTDSGDFTATAGAFQPNYDGGDGDGFLAVIQQFPATTTSLSVTSGTTVTVGSSITLKATVSGAAGSPTGTVTFSVVLAGSTVPIGSANVVKGVATLTASSAGMAAGSYPVQAAYLGDNKDQPSTSSKTTLTLVKASTSVVVTASPNPVTRPATETLTATVKGTNGAGLVTGTVTFYVGAMSLGSHAVSNGKAVLRATTDGLAAGTYPVTATYMGNSYYNASTSPAASVVVK